MKTFRALGIALLAATASLLAGCEVYVYGVLEPFSLQSATYNTNYSYGGSAVVCDDRTTQFEIALQYRGEIERVSIDLVGDYSGERYSLASFSPSASENENGQIRRTFSVRRRVSPLGVAVLGTGFGESDGFASPQSIIVVPVDPEIIGYTFLEMRIETETADRTIGSRNIPVFNFCD